MTRGITYKQIEHCGWRMGGLTHFGELPGRLFTICDQMLFACEDGSNRILIHKKGEKVFDGRISSGDELLKIMAENDLGD